MKLKGKSFLRFMHYEIIRNPRFTKKNISSVDSKHKYGKKEKPYFIFHFLEIQNMERLQFVNDIKPVIRFLRNIVIQQTKELELRKRR